jgi:hypothetical protein
MLGIVAGNYAGSNGIYLNPSSIANDKIRWDLNIVTADVFLFNDYFYLPKKKANFFNVISGEYDFPYYDKPHGTGERNIYTYYKDKSPKHIFSNVRVIGPSAMFRFEKDHSFAVHTAFRSISSTDMPYDMANFMFHTMDFDPQHNIRYERDNYHASAVAFCELGVTYANVIRRTGRHHWSGGITMNYLFAHAGGYYSGGYTDYVVYNDSILNVNELNGEYGVAMPVDYTSDDPKWFEEPIKGSGFGVDIGFTYQFRRKGYRRPLLKSCYQKCFEPYDFKISVALLDVGFVTMSTNAQKHRFDGVSNNHINVQQIDYNNLQAEMEEISELLYGDPKASYVDDRFSLILPTALSIQYDYHLKDPFYISGIAIVPMKVFGSQMRRPYLLAVVPRYETRHIEINLPVSLYDLQYPHIGLSIRIHDFTIGSDRLGGFFTNRDFTGADVYFSYKVNLDFPARKCKPDKNNPCKW